MKTKVVILKKFNSPAVDVRVENDELAISMSLVDFLESISGASSASLAAAAAAHAGNPTLLITNEMLKRKLEESIDSDDVFSALWSASIGVLAEMKKASVVAQ